MNEPSSELDPAPGVSGALDASGQRLADRFFLDAPLVVGRAVLAGDEAHHLTRVLRAAVGDEVTLFDGRGTEARARVVALGRREVELDVVALGQPDRELAVEVTLAVALPKGDRQRWLIEKMVELGVTRLVPLRTARSVARPGASALERLARQVIEASKQCGRNRLMAIAAPSDWPTLVDAAPPAALRLVAHPRGGRPLLAAIPARLTGPVVLAVGPEGGFTPEEIARAAAAGWQRVDLGPRVLRIETAALVLAAHAAAHAGRRI